MPVKPIADISDPRYVKALSHPLRVRILALLEERTVSPRELADWLDATLGPSATTCARCTGLGCSSWSIRPDDRRVCPRVGRRGRL